MSLPVFFTGLLLVYLSSTSSLGWAPAPLGRLDVFFAMAPETVTGFYLIDSADRARLRDLPRRAGATWRCLRITLAIFALAPIARMTRASMLAVLSSEFVRTARRRLA